MTRILGLLQNQWFRNPERAKMVLALYEQRGKGRNLFIRDMLFLGCLTGRRIKRAFGEELCNRIIWEEVSPQMGGHAASVFPPDPAHVKASLEKHRPDLMIVFGKIAESALTGAVAEYIQAAGVKVVVCPHPAARGAGIVERLGIANKEALAHLAAIKAATAG
jgi:hypothetical protein